ncbi:MULTISPECIES: DUF960 family protein [Brevibacillus]|uniref:DUF960 family protein n=1 Tax=Brevibacillus TaxID=55080 RepID=UPI000ED8B365|nr:DUF960 family protein [Brevibacillus sp.]HBZ83237.1 hypothetical protein [Brevibacillus sp.]
MKQEFVPRCTSKTINKILSDELKLLLYSFIDQLVANDLEMDWAQIFELKSKAINEKYVLHITHRQEHPFRCQEYEVESNYPHFNLTVWILDFGDYSLMLLPEDIPHISFDPFDEDQYFDDLYFDDLFKYEPNNFRPDN